MSEFLSNITWPGVAAFTVLIAGICFVIWVLARD